MITIQGYTFIQQIYEGYDTLVFRGYRDSDKEPVIVKLLKEDFAKGKTLAAFKHEYKLLKSLKGTATVNAYELIPYENSMLILMEQFGAPLNEIIVKGALNLHDFLSIALQITIKLETLQNLRILHKDLNPNNILWEPATQTAKIIDFGISSTIAREEATLPNLQILEGSLPYISPEQTGRMNRGIDYRTDFYSLGIIFYEMITGEKPFQSKDPLQLIHSHIAKLPIAPHEVNPEIPKVISKIILKLMAKNAEDRYQSTYGIKVDLQRCLDELNHTGKIQDFTIASNDIPAQLTIPEKLYGREQEVKELLEAFSRASSGSAELMLVMGHPGVGKSRLIHEIYKTIAEKQGYFITGKFEQFKQSLPYASLIQAFQGLVQQMLGESDEAIKEWRDRILKAVEPNGQVMIEVIPELSQIIGPQPAIPKLDTAASQNRFNLVFQNFVQSLASADHPLVIFFDDLQWADSSSIKVLEMLLKNIDSRHFLMICAYRDNDLDAINPIVAAFKHIREAGIQTNVISLKPLQLENVTHLLQDTLHSPADKILPLAEICFDRTHGNPFFLLQLLQELYKEEFIQFDAARGQWTYQLTRIQQEDFTNNVVEFMTKRIRELPSSTQNILQLAACLGSTFDLETLVIVSEKEKKEVAEDLWPALQTGMIVPLDEAYKFAGDENIKNAKFQFLHDRVLQAAYGLAVEKNISVVHTNIGRALLKHTEPDQLEEKALDIANHFNMGLELLVDPVEKQEVAELNLIAGNHAKQSVAFEQSLAFFKFGMSLLAENSWETQYQLTLDLYTAAAETANLATDYKHMDFCLESIIKNAKSSLDKAVAYRVRCMHLLSRNRLQDTIDVGVTALNEFGMKITQSPSKVNILYEYLRSKWYMRGRSFESLYNAPPIDDPYNKAIMDITRPVVQAMYLADPALFVLFALKGFERAFAKGVDRNLFLFCGVYGVICMLFHQTETGYQYGKLGLRLLERYQIKETLPFANMVFYSVIAHWRQPISTCLEPLRDNFHKSLEVGDILAAGFCAFSYVATVLYSGKSLSKVIDEAQHFSHALVKVGDNTNYQYISIIWWCAMHLSGKDPAAAENNQIAFDEKKLLKESMEKKDNEAICLIYLNKIYFNYILEQYTEAYLDITRAITYSEMVKGKEYYFITSLVYLINSDIIPEADRAMVQKNLSHSLKMLRLWSKESPFNYLQKYYLIQAEHARANKKIESAKKYYNLAINVANKNGFLQDEAIANELAAKFYFSLDQKDLSNTFIARGYLLNAYQCYARWGAFAKTKLLEEKYPKILSQQQSESWSYDSAIKNIHISQSTSTSDLDLASVMKASQAISKEIVLSDMLIKMMSILIENTGAQKCYFLIQHNGRWLIEAEGNVDGEPKVLHLASSEGKVPLSVINTVSNLKKPVVVDDATKHEQFGTDPYVARTKPKSILCLPLLSQGVVKGILYFENNITENAFPKSRVKLVDMLSTQIVTSLENARLYNYLKETNEAYYRFLPVEFLKLLKKTNITEIQLGDQTLKNMSVLTFDIRGFSTISEQMTPRENIDFINAFFACAQPVISRHSGFIDKFIGDAIMALYPEDQHADNAVKSAIALLQALDSFNKQHSHELPEVRIGVGISSGSCMLGTVGDSHRMEGTVISDVVNTAFRLEPLSKIYGVPIIISQAVFDNLKNVNQYCLRKLDIVHVKGKQKAVTIYEVYDHDPEEMIQLKNATNESFQKAVNLFHDAQHAMALEIFEEILKLNPNDNPAQLYADRCKEILNIPIDPDKKGVLLRLKKP